MRVIFTYISLLLSSILYSQDSIVFYSGFEENFQPVYSTYDITEFNSKWFSSWASPDIFSTNSQYDYYNVPINAVGYQEPLLGESYGGFGTICIGFGPNLPEWFGTKLSDSLLEGQSYCIKFSISLADTVEYASGNIGVYFSTDSIYMDSMPAPPTPYPVNYDYVTSTPNSTVFLNTESWTKIELHYTAKGGERYMYLGNFFPDSLTNYQYVGNSMPSYGFAYYYIDEVYVYKCEGVSIKENTVSPITIYPNPGNGIFTIENTKPIKQLKIYSSYGQLIYTASPTSNQTTVDLMHLPAGIYLCNIDGYSIKLIKE